MPKRRHITGLTAVRLANEKRAPLTLLPSESADQRSDKPEGLSIVKKFPPRVRQAGKPGDVVLAPQTELQAHKAAFREIFGETLSDEFVDVMLTHLISALRPRPFDGLEESTLNAAIALIASVRPRNELGALIAVQIVATGFAALKFLKHSQRHLDEAFIGVYGGYAAQLLRLQLDLIQALDKHRRGHKQTVEVRHVHIHSGGQGVVGIINSRKEGDAGGEGEK